MLESFRIKNTGFFKVITTYGKLSFVNSPIILLGNSKIVLGRPP